ncbi:hypothetical protein SAMN04244553_1359 [Nocardia amikacinitolerans]|uniref:Integral membrane protein n=1 Tax=Nocardia amikacinitolerans TaxID=756689 RepID=A0A285L182_9NOCA|nr:hypothetical protein [Nocardia amikacinitolerans]MCP2296754.1 hypothetical protein [Nocardia amikacinitolerans]MCP2317979.1 hypothetical protein [Nocardia amikacinitolerans]SNY78682.1 hypothetical protein SAMN04244553_1359 [Nocardia amikacinitolerans]
MELVYNVVVVTHLLGMAAVIGGYAAGQPKVNEVMVWGARAQIVTGIVLVGMAESIGSLDKDLDMVKIGVKLVISVLVAGFAEVARADAKRGKDVPWMTHAAGGLGIVNVFVAVLWS